MNPFHLFLSLYFLHDFFYFFNIFFLSFSFSFCSPSSDTLFFLPSFLFTHFFVYSFDQLCLLFHSHPFIFTTNPSRNPDSSPFPAVLSFFALSRSSNKPGTKIKIRNFFKNFFSLQPATEQMFIFLICKR